MKHIDEKEQQAIYKESRYRWYRFLEEEMSYKEWDICTNPIDVEVAESTICEHCGEWCLYVGRKYKNKKGGRSRYRAFAVCPQCFYWTEF